MRRSRHRSPYCPLQGQAQYRVFPSGSTEPRSLEIPSLTPWLCGYPVVLTAVFTTLCSLCLWLPQACALTQEIAILKSADLTAYNQAVTAAKSSFGPSFTLLEYNLKGNLERGRKLARKIRASEAKLVLAVGLKAALTAKLEILDVPVVYTMVLDPAKYDLSAPNMTGVLLEVPIARQLAGMREAIPIATRIGVLFDPDKTGHRLKQARRPANALGIQIISRAIRTEKDVPEATRSLLPEIQALWLLPDSTVLNEDSLRFLLHATLEANVPVIGFSAELVRSGALFSLSVDYKDLGVQAAQISKDILTGRLSLPHQTIPPSQIRMTVNLKTAKYLGIALPPRVIEQAHERY